MEKSDKTAWRRHFNAIRQGLSAEWRQQADLKICATIRKLPEWQRAQCVAMFVRLGAEPDLSELFGEKRTFLPRYNAAKQEYDLVEIQNPQRDLVEGKYHIPEPRPDLPAATARFIAQEMLFLVPAVACDQCGMRLGRGGGYYDRLLKNIQRPAIGVIYNAQLSTSPLPCEAHDRPLEIVVTEVKSWQCAGSTGQQRSKNDE